MRNLCFDIVFFYTAKEGLCFSCVSCVFVVFIISYLPNTGSFWHLGFPQNPSKITVNWQSVDGRIATRSGFILFLCLVLKDNIYPIKYLLVKLYRYILVFSGVFLFLSVCVFIFHWSIHTQVGTYLLTNLYGLLYALFITLLYKRISRAWSYVGGQS